MRQSLSIPSDKPFTDFLFVLNSMARQEIRLVSGRSNDKERRDLVSGGINQVVSNGKSKMMLKSSRQPL